MQALKIMHVCWIIFLFCGTSVLFDFSFYFFKGCPKMIQYKSTLLNDIRHYKSVA